MDKSVLELWEDKIISDEIALININNRILRRQIENPVSANPEPAPIFASMMSSAPARTSFLAVSGVIGTRFSPGWVSLGTAMRIAVYTPYYLIVSRTKAALAR